MLQIGKPIYLGDKFSVFTAPAGFSQFPHFEIPIPANKLSYKGHDIETHAFVSYKYIEETGEYEQIKLHIFLKPSDTDGMSNDLKHIISEYGNHNTVVIHNLFHKRGNKHKLRGEADVYARAFSPQACTSSDMAK